MKIKYILLIGWLCFSLASSSFALFDTGTAMARGKLELDLCLNPFKDITYGQNFVFGHYGLGQGYEIHGYLSKYGTMWEWNQKLLNEYYCGILKQWAKLEKLDLATCLGYRGYTSDNPGSIIGPGILYTIKINPQNRLAGHIQLISTIDQQGRLVPFGLGWTYEIGYYYRFNDFFELAIGDFANSQGEGKPIYTMNFYF